MDKLVTVDQETGEIVLSPDTDDEKWGSTAADLLAAITEGPHYRKKRRTILLLADAAYLNHAMTSVWKVPDAASSVAHYKWLSNDAEYAAAYSFIVGTAVDPGLSRTKREDELDEEELLAVGSLLEARTKLRLFAAKAVNTLGAALDAVDRYGPQWRERIQAANSILDRADADTASRTAAPTTQIDKAIMTIYATKDTHVVTPGPASKPVAGQAGQQANDMHDHASSHVSDAVSSAADDDIYDGELLEPEEPDYLPSRVVASDIPSNGHDNQTLLEPGD